MNIHKHLVILVQHDVMASIFPKENDIVRCQILHTPCKQNVDF